jgi:hypothetical protein
MYAKYILKNNMQTINKCTICLDSINYSPTMWKLGLFYAIRKNITIFWKNIEKILQVLN